MLLEHDVPHQAFSQAVLSFLPKMPWSITEKVCWKEFCDFMNYCIWPTSFIWFLYVSFKNHVETLFPSSLAFSLLQNAQVMMKIIYFTKRQTFVGDRHWVIAHFPKARGSQIINHEVLLSLRNKATFYHNYCWFYRAVLHVYHQNCFLFFNNMAFFRTWKTEKTWDIWVCVVWTPQDVLI